MNEMRSKHCPDRDSLKLMLLGKMTGADARALEAHLLQCDQCVSAAETIALNDDVTDAFRNHKRLEGEEDVVDDVIERATQLWNKEETRCGEETGVSSSAEPVSPEVESAIPEVDEALLGRLAPPETPGEIGRLGNYRVLEVLGCGGMGVVFLAEDLQLRRPVALKVMRPTAATDREAKDRFLREARATAAIEHDHIVSIYQVGEERGVPYIAMPYLRGESLETRLKRERRLDQREALRIGRELADGLAAAHHRGLIHRDVKPANVWLEENTNRVKIVDFGLVLAVDDDAGLTGSGVILGTPRYTSPEQAQGHEVDYRCDLFSLGSLLYRVVAGKPAFAGRNTTAALIAVAQHGPEPLENLVPGLDPDFAALISGLLQKDPNLRPQSATEVSNRIADIERKIHSESVPDSSPPNSSPDSREPDAPLVPPETSQPDEPATDSLATSQTAFSGPPTKRRSLLLSAAAVVLLLLPLSYFFGGTFIRFVANQGLLVVEVDDPNVEIAVRQNGLVVQDKTTDREFQLKAVAGQIEVYEKGGNLRLLTKKFTLARGGKAYVTVTLQELAQVRSSKGEHPRPSAKEPLTSMSGPWQPTREQRDFLDTVAKLEPEGQIEAVRERLQLVNPGFDGKLVHKIENGRVVELWFDSDPAITDVWPLRALPHLERLFFTFPAQWPRELRLADLSPLQGMKLTALDCRGTQVADLSVLKGMKLTRLDCSITQITDLSPLKGMPLTDLGCSSTQVADLSVLRGMELTNLTCPGTQVADLSALKGMKLTALNCSSTQVADLSVLKGMKLTHLDCSITQVTDLSPLQDVPLTSLKCDRTGVSDLSPLQGMPLTWLDCSGTEVSDLSPLQGMPLTWLKCDRTGVSDLTPLQGMPLTTLNCSSTQVANLSPLQGMPLRGFDCSVTQVSDLYPLQGMPLTSLKCDRTGVSDLSPLQGMKLTELTLQVRLCCRMDETLLKSLPLETLNGTPVAEFWKQFAARRKAAEQFVESAAKLTAEKQVEAVRARLADLNPAHLPVTLGAKPDGRTVTEATLVLSDYPHDLTPLMAFGGLKKLTITGGSDWLDLSPLTLLPLEELTCPEPMARKNVPVLADIRTLRTINGHPAAAFCKPNPI